MKLPLFFIFIFFPVLQTFAQNPVPATGTASYYHAKFEGRKTASGEIFCNDSLTAAHKTLPFGTFVMVTHLKNKNQVLVRINDRLPSNSKRSIDLTKKAATALNMIQSGLAKVQIEVIEAPSIETESGN